MNNYKDKVAVITGAASGIGFSLALRLAQQGAIVYACDMDAHGLESLLAQHAGSIHSITLNVTDQSAVEGALDQAYGQHQRLDYVFNNAGIVVGGAFEDMTDEAWKKIVDINLWGVVYGSQHAYRLMLKQGFGHIINTASTAGVTPVAKSTAYAATKHAVVGLSTSLREEGRAHGVKVSVAIPGLVDTNIFSRATNLKEHDYDANMKKLPIGKISPEQAATAILRGVESNDAHIIFPGYNRLIVAGYRAAPNFVGRLINQDA